MLKLEKLILKEDEKTECEKKVRQEQLNKLGKPKRPVAPFLVFSHDLRQNTAKKLSSTDIAAKWKTLNDVERKTYTDKANENSKRYR